MYKFLLDLFFITNAVAGGWYALACSNGRCQLNGWTSLPAASNFVDIVPSSVNCRKYDLN